MAPSRRARGAASRGRGVARARSDRGAVMLTPARIQQAERRARSRPSPSAVNLVVPANIIEFVTDWLGVRLFPRQATLLKLVACATDLMTDYDHRVVEEWRSGSRLERIDEGLAWVVDRGVTGDIYDRIEWCQR